EALKLDQMEHRTVIADVERHVRLIELAQKLVGEVQQSRGWILEMKSSAAAGTKIVRTHVSLRKKNAILESKNFEIAAQIRNVFLKHEALHWLIVISVRSQIFAPREMCSNEIAYRCPDRAPGLAPT